MNELYVSYASWKQVVGSAPLYYVVIDNGYQLYATGQEHLVSAVITQAEDIDNFETYYKSKCAEVNTKDDAFLQGMLANGVKLVPGQPDAPNKRLLVVNFPADFGSNLWLTSRGDDLVNQKRGRGTKLAHKFDDVTRTEYEEKSVEIQFMEQIQLHDGHIDLADPVHWDITTDEWELSVTMAANTVTPNVGNTGNCNLVDMGGYNAIVPAAGDGAYDVDLETAVPLPSPGGGWDYDYFHDALTFPTDPASTNWALLDVPYEVFVQTAVNVPASPMGMFDFDAYDAQRVSPRWKIKFTVRKLSSGPGAIAGWIVCFREQNT